MPDFQTHTLNQQALVLKRKENQWDKSLEDSKEGRGMDPVKHRWDRSGPLLVYASGRSFYRMVRTRVTNPTDHEPYVWHYMSTYNYFI